MHVIGTYEQSSTNAFRLVAVAHVNLFFGAIQQYAHPAACRAIPMHGGHGTRHMIASTNATSAPACMHEIEHADIEFEPACIY